MGGLGGANGEVDAADAAISGMTTEQVTALWGAGDPFASGTKGQLVTQLTQSVTDGPQRFATQYRTSNRWA